MESLGSDGFDQEVTLPRVREDDLGEQGAADNKPNRHPKAGEAWQERIANGVFEQNLFSRQTFGMSQTDVLRAHDPDHRVSHNEEPAADRCDDDG